MISSSISRIARCAIVLLSALAAVTSPTSALAQPHAMRCSGILHQSGGDLTLGGGRGEDEGICVINKTQATKVLAACQTGKSCIVEGNGDNCKDSGECTELLSVTTAKRGK